MKIVGCLIVRCMMRAACRWFNLEVRVYDLVMGGGGKDRIGRGREKVRGVQDGSSACFHRTMNSFTFVNHELIYLPVLT
jgi:hypothetical protein